MAPRLTLAEGDRAGAELDDWARALDRGRPADHVIRLPDFAAEPSPILERLEDGGFRVGRYAGELRLDGQRLELAPGGGWRAFTAWVRAAMTMAEPIAGMPDVPLVGLVWCRAVDSASRHGPPAFRRDVMHTGSTVRGHLDIRRTVRMRAKGESTVASVYRSRELDNPVTRIIVAADQVLVRRSGHTRWRTERVDDILPQLQVAVGRRPRLPRAGELLRMRYTPITRPFKWAAEVSAQVVRQDPMATTPAPGRVQGLVLDVAAIRHLAVTTWCRAARPDLLTGFVDGRTVLADAGGMRALLMVDPLPARDGSVRITTAAGGETVVASIGPEARDAAATLQSLLTAV